MRTDVLYIDLSNNSHEVKDRSDIFKSWLGGVGVGTQLIKEELKMDTDPLSKENIIVFAVGPFTSAYPYASKTVALFKSPLTENWGESHAGGRTATSIANAGFGAIVIKGKAKIPTYLVIENGKVHFRDARVIWGIDDSKITSRIIAEREGGSGIRAVMTIGGAGEKLVRYACVTTELYRHFGRLGLGAVFGSKHLKGIVVIGRNSYRPEKGKEYREIYDKIFEISTESDAMNKYHLLGTSANVNPLNEIKALPINNLLKSNFEGNIGVSGEEFAEHSLGMRIACDHCPTACIHIASLREPYEGKKYFYKTLMVAYDYEPIYALGTMLGLFTRDAVLKLIHKTELYTIDAISTGACLAWATEALDRGIISKKDTLLDLKFGDHENYLECIDNIVKQPTDFYKMLALGLEKTSEVFGGKEFALTFCGNEMPGYHTGPGCHIGYILGLRHSHCDNAGYSLDQENIDKDISPKELVDQLIVEEEWRQILSSLVLCFFSRGVYTPEIVSKALDPLGIKMDKNDFDKLGRKIYLEKLELKKKMGFDLNNIRIPERIFQTESSKGMINKEYLDEALDYYINKFG